MKKLMQHTLLWVFIVLTSLLLISCNESEVIQLDAPTNVSILGNVVSWNAVEQASGYTVSVDNTEYQVQTTSYTILLTLPGTYQVKVRADGKGNYQTSSWSANVSYVIHEPEPIVYAISETFDDPAAVNEWDLGETQNMHDVQNGQLILTNTGVTPYPSRGKHLKVTLSEYPYLAVKVDDLGGSSPRWAIKILMAGDETSSRSVTPNDMSTTGLFFFDLTKVDGLENLDEAEFDLYIYIIESEGNYIKIDYLQSLANVPEINNFNHTSGITITGGTMVAEHGVLRISSTGSGQASAQMNLYLDTNIANMLDLFISEVGESSTFSLKVDGKTVINNATRYGHFGLDLEDFEIEKTGYANIEFIVNGEISIDRIANVVYHPYIQTFAAYDDETIYDLVSLIGSADVEVNDNDELVLYKVAALAGDAKVRLSGVSNFSTYPKFVFEVAAIDANTTLRVNINGHTVKNVTEVGTYEADLTSIYQSGYRIVTVEFFVIAEEDASVTISGYSFIRDENLSMNALPEKGDRVELEGMIIEEGVNSDNWGGNATIFSRNGQIWIVNTEFFSKGEVFAKNVDLSDYRYLNMQLDELTPGTTWKIDIVYNVGLPGEQVVTIQNEISAIGLFTYDLYALLNLNESSKITERISVNFFIIGGSGKIAQIDYLNLKQTPEAENEIILVKPVDNVLVGLEAEVLVSASLKFALGQVSIKVERNGVDVTSTVLVNGVFSADVEGIYTITYSANDVESKTRTITVSAEAVIVTDNTSTTIHFDQPLDILAEVEPDDGSVVTYEAFLGDDDVSDIVFTERLAGVRFMAPALGDYRIVMKSATTEPVEITVTVVSGWVSETSGTNQNTVVDGNIVFSYEGDFYWPKHEKTVTVKKEQPFLVVDAHSIAGGTWKLDIDTLMNNAIPENASAGLHVIDLTSLLGELDERVMKFTLLIVGGNVRLELNEFVLLSEAEVAENFNSIINVFPATRPTVSVNTPINVSAALKYAIDGQAVSIKVFDADELDVTSSVLNAGVVTLTRVGIYQIVYESPYATSVVRTVTVIDESQPILSTSNDSEATLDLKEAYPLNIEIENPVLGEVVTFVVTKDDELDDLSATLIEEGVFAANETGVYTVTISYPGAADLVQTLTVVSGWEHQVVSSGEFGSKFANDEFTLYYVGSHNWPKSTYRMNITTDLTPFVSFTVNSITGGTWKFVLGDVYPHDIIAEGTTTGHILIDLRAVAALAGYGETHKELNMAFEVLIVGTDVELKLTPFALLTLAEVAQQYNQITNISPEPNTSVLPNQEVNVLATLKYPVVGESVAMTVKDEANLDVTDTVLIGGKFKAETPGLYTVYYTSALADPVTRVIEVVAPETPMITSTSDALKTILIDEEYVIQASVENPVDGQTLSYAVYKDGGEIDIAPIVFDVSTMTFVVDATGSYAIVISYLGADDLILTVVVQTAWELEVQSSGTFEISYADGVTTIHYNGDYYWPSAKIAYAVTTDETPYLLLQVDNITGGTWKMDLGKEYTTELIPASGDAGQIIIDLRDYVAAAGYAQTNLELNMTFTVFIVGGDVTLEISAMQFLTQAERDLLP